MNRQTAPAPCSQKKKGKESKKKRVRANNARDSVLREHDAHVPALRPPHRMLAPCACAPRRPRLNNEVPLPLLVASRDRVRAQRGRAPTMDFMEEQGAHVGVGGRTASAVCEW
jgi:hypothetical protein